MHTQVKSSIKSRFQSLWVQLFLVLAVVFTFQLMSAAPAVAAPEPECRDNGDCLDDNNFCNGFPLCLDGICEQTPVCTKDTGNPCTVLKCDEVRDNCAEVPNDEGRCDLESLCSVDDFCQGGECQPGKGPCPDDDVCNDWECNFKDGKCFQIQEAGAECNADDLFCTLDFCDFKDPITQVSECKVDRDRECKDGVFCTDDTCDDEIDKCVFEKRAECCETHEECNDPDACNGRESCDVDTGICHDGKDWFCPIDDNPCITSQGCETIDEKAECVTTYKDVGAACVGDEDLCTVGSCKDKAAIVKTGGDPVPTETECVEEDKPCPEDDLVCSESFCNETTGDCEQDVVGCLCTSDEDCDTGNPCLESRCEVPDGEATEDGRSEEVVEECSEPEALVGESCDDGDVCTGEDQCNEDGGCSGTDLPNCPPVFVAEPVDEAQELVPADQVQAGGCKGGNTFSSLHGVVSSSGATLIYWGWGLIVAALYLQRRRRK